MHRMVRAGLALWLGLVSCARSGMEQAAARGALPPAAPQPPAQEGAHRTSPAQPVRRRALLVGINDYSASQLAPASAPGAVHRRFVPDLEGAVDDVLDMRQMLLARYGFAPGDILVLTDQAATRQAVLRAIEQHLVEPTRPGDVVFFFWSGHGSQVFDPQSEKPDRMDETLVPADAVQGVPDLRDKELRQIFNRVLDRGARLTVLLDSCHAASAIRGLLDEAHPRSVEPDPRAVKDGERYGPRPEDRGALVLAAAQSFGTAYETVDELRRHHGAFTLAWMRALRDAAAGEPVAETFQRARARLQAEPRSQDPVLSGNAGVRQAPFLGQAAGANAGRMIVAVEGREPDGTVVLAGGRANGLTAGSELRLLAPGREVRIVVTELDGWGRCKGRVSGPVPAALKSGALTEVVRWAPPPGPPLRIWMATITDLGPATQLARQLAKQAPPQGVRWVDDPTRQAPTHVLRWDRQGWQLLARGGAAARLGPAPDAAAVLAQIRGQEPRALFVQLPVPAALAQAIAIGPGSRYSGIEAAERPEEADVVLTGRLVQGGLEYAWLRPGMAAADRPRTSLPVRTEWQPLSREQTGGALMDALLLLRKIQGWLRLESPPGMASAYELVIRQGVSGARPVDRRILVGKRFYNLALRLKAGVSPERVQRRFVYVFAIDSAGNGQLLFPNPKTPYQNLYPATAENPVEISLAPDGVFRADPPYGTDTYFLLTSGESLPDPAVLSWRGFSSRGPRGATPFAELLALTGGWMRAATPVTPADWSVESQPFESVDPSLAGSENDGREELR